jgi:hypothetical protein
LLPATASRATRAAAPVAFAYTRLPLDSWSDEGVDELQPKAGRRAGRTHIMYKLETIETTGRRRVSSQLYRGFRRLPPDAGHAAVELSWLILPLLRVIGAPVKQHERPRSVFRPPPLQQLRTGL